MSRTKAQLEEENKNLKERIKELEAQAQVIAAEESSESPVGDDTIDIADAEANAAEALREIYGLFRSACQSTEPAAKPEADDSDKDTSDPEAEEDDEVGQTDKLTSDDPANPANKATSSSSDDTRPVGVIDDAPEDESDKASEVKTVESKTVDSAAKKPSNILGKIQNADDDIDDPDDDYDLDDDDADADLTYL